MFIFAKGATIHFPSKQVIFSSVGMVLWSQM